MLQGQKDSFSNEGKGTEITEELMHHLRSMSAGTAYPVLGMNTSEADLVEASFVLDRDTTTVLDIERLRACNSKEDYEEGPWAERGQEDNLHARENLSQVGESLKQRIASSLEECNEEQKKIGRPDEEEKDLFYRKWNHFLVELTGLLLRSHICDHTADRSIIGIQSDGVVKHYGTGPTSSLEKK